MNIADVMDELGTALDTIDGLRVFPYSAPSINPPAAVVGWPALTYDATFGRGGDRMEIPVTVLVGRADMRSSRDALTPYINGSGASSVKAVLEAHTATSYHSARVESVAVSVESVAAVDYLAATFRLDIIGSGS